MGNFLNKYINEDEDWVTDDERDKLISKVQRTREALKGKEREIMIEYSCQKKIKTEDKEEYKGKLRVVSRGQTCWKEAIPIRDITEKICWDCGNRHKLFI